VARSRNCARIASNTTPNLPNSSSCNNGNGTFTDVSAETGIAKYYAQGDGRGDRDATTAMGHGYFVANDNRPNSCSTIWAARNSRGRARIRRRVHAKRQRGFRYGRRFQGRGQRWPPGHLAHRRGERVLSVYLTVETASSGREPCKRTCRGRGDMSGWGNGNFRFR